MVHFVIFEKWTSNYEISISILWVHTICCDIANYFCQKCPILSFCERTVDFFASSILSKMLNFVIFWETRVFFRFFNFVKSAQFCHFVRGPWIFSLLHFCQKCSILSFCERPVYFFSSSILSFSERPMDFSILPFCQKCSILSFSERPVHFFSIFQFLSKMVHFVIFETRTSNYEISI